MHFMWIVDLTVRYKVTNALIISMTCTLAYHFVLVKILQTSSETCNGCFIGILGYKCVNRSRGVHQDISCQTAEDKRCVHPTWTNSAWSGGNVPDIKELNPPEKDTVILPAGGYVVVRFRANNPGKVGTM